MERVKNGEANYHLIEVLACRRGCIMGGGQPTRSGDRTKAARARGLYLSLIHIFIWKNISIY